MSGGFTSVHFDPTEKTRQTNISAGTSDRAVHSASLHEACRGK